MLTAQHTQYAHVVHIHAGEYVAPVSRIGPLGTTLLALCCHLWTGSSSSKNWLQLRIFGLSKEAELRVVVSNTADISRDTGHVYGNQLNFARAVMTW